MDDKIHPCPVCESENIDMKSADTDDGHGPVEYWLECENCGFKAGESSETDGFRFYKLSVYGWNETAFHVIRALECYRKLNATAK